MAIIVKHVIAPDGRIRRMFPTRNRRGFYVVAPRDTKYRNLKEHQREIAEDDELVRLALTDEWCIRMRYEDDPRGPWSLIAPGSYEVREALPSHLEAVDAPRRST